MFTCFVQFEEIDLFDFDLILTVSQILTVTDQCLKVTVNVLLNL